MELIITISYIELIKEVSMVKRKKYLGLFLIIVSILLFVFWEARGRTLITTEEMLILNENIEEQQVINENMFDVRNVVWASNEALKPDDISEILGKVATQFVHKEAPLFLEYFEKTALIPNENRSEYIMAIPNDWLLSYPQSLRRGDTAYLYCNGKLIIKSVVAHTKDCSNKEVVSEDANRLEGSSNISLVEVILNKSQAAKLAEIANEGNRFVIMYN